MALKYFILAFLAIQTVNAGVIKPTSLAQEFEDILLWIRIHSWTSSGLHSQLGYVFRNSADNIHNITEQAVSIGTTVLKEMEEFITESAEWSIVCFEGLQDKVALVNEELVANTEKCLEETEVIVKEFQVEADYFDKTATELADSLNATWINCNNDGPCQQGLLLTAQKALDELTVDYLEFKGRIEAYIYSGFPELESCVDSYFISALFVKLVDVLRPVQECLDHKNPNSL